MAKKDRTGNRRSRDTFRKRIPDMGYYFIVTDTEETEANYFHGLRDSLPDVLKGRLVVKVMRTKTSNLVKAARELASLEPQYGQPWIVLDRDKVPDFDELIEDAEKKNISVGWSNPCIEIWFESYFGSMHPYKDSVSCCKGFADVYRRWTGLCYRKSDRLIYSHLSGRGNEDTAIRIARQRFEQQISNGRTKPSRMHSCTTLFRLVSEIRIKAGNPE